VLERRPEISLVTNVSPNHLDRHKTYGCYLDAKKTILEGGTSDGWAILNGDDSLVRSWATGLKRAVTYFGSAGPVRPRARGVWLEGDTIVFSEGPRGERHLFRREDLPLPGRFNAINAAGAAAAALAAGCRPETFPAALRSFRPVEHRLELVRRLGGVEYYNDSIATTPESTLCAMEALGPDLILIAGGSSKGASFRRLGSTIARRTRGAVLIGETAQDILEAIRRNPQPVPAHLAESLEGAIDVARSLARPGFRIILSPACASYDMFVNFEERGRRFKEIVKGL
jgi:UDP-N-acetylmuramoylalanine--D-glutamate ligase